MGATERYRQELRRRGDWEPYLLEHSGLPGPRANLELLRAVVEEGDTPFFLSLLRHDARKAPTGSREEFLAACGAAGLGRSIALGDTSLWPTLRALASDPRWRVREGVAMALQRIGDRNMGHLLSATGAWLGGGPLERRAVAAGLCEPRLLKDRAAAEAVLGVLDELTRSLGTEEDRRAPEVRVLRQALGYCWSVAIAARPEPGRERLEAWAGIDDPDIRWLVCENLKKKRLRRLDPAWAHQLSARVGP